MVLCTAALVSVCEREMMADADIISKSHRDDAQVSLALHFLARLYTCEVFSESISYTVFKAALPFGVSKF